MPFEPTRMSGDVVKAISALWYAVHTYAQTDRSS